MKSHRYRNGRHQRYHNRAPRYPPVLSYSTGGRLCRLNRASSLAARFRPIITTACISSSSGCRRHGSFPRSVRVGHLVLERLVKITGAILGTLGVVEARVFILKYGIDYPLGVDPEGAGFKVPRRRGKFLVLPFLLVSDLAVGPGLHGYTFAGEGGHGGGDAGGQGVEVDGLRATYGEGVGLADGAVVYEMHP